MSKQNEQNKQEQKDLIHIAFEYSLINNWKYYKKSYCGL